MKALILLAAAALAGCDKEALKHDTVKAEAAFQSCMAATPVATSPNALDRKIDGCRHAAWASQ